MSHATSCPICSAESAPKYRPFCSKRCADVDLGRWLGGNYAIPSQQPEDLEQAAQEIMARDGEAKPH